MSRQPPVVGIIGSIGSGKSAVAAGIADRLGGLRLDADAIGHALLFQQDIKDELKSHFGSLIFDRSGEVIRRELANQVFGEAAEKTQNRRFLEQLLHPRIREGILQQITKVKGQGSASIIILDAAVMLEAGWSGDCDLLLCIDAPRELRLRRVFSRGWDDAELRRRELNQWSLDDKSSRADLTIQNDQSLQTAVDLAVKFIIDRFPQLEKSLAEMA